MQMTSSKIHQPIGAQPQQLPSQQPAKYTLTIKGTVITNSYIQRLIDAWSTIKMRKFLQDGQGWTDETFHSIDWDNFKTDLTKIFK